MPQIIDSLDNAPDIPHEEAVSSEIAFDGDLLTVRVDTVKTPSGKKANREIIEHPGSAVIVPVTTDGKVLFIRQFRYVTGDYLLELPAGLIDEGEDPLECAKRELQEETHHEAGSIRHLSTVYISPGYSEEVTTIYLAEDCTPIELEDDEDEPIQMLPIPLEDVRGLMPEGDQRVADAQTLLGMLWLVRLGLA